MEDQRSVIVIGGGHNGLVAATLLALAGRSVLLLERAATVGGASVSAAPFVGVDARLSRYSYLVSLFPRWLLEDLIPGFQLRRRSVSSYTPVGDGGILDRQGLTLPGAEQLAASLAGALTSPLGVRSVEHELFRRPMSELLEAAFEDDVVRGIVGTDALIGTFASLADPGLQQNRCFLYHVVGGPWDLPIGGMGALSDALRDAALAAGVEIETNCEVVEIDPAGERVAVRTADGREYVGRDVVAAVAPACLSALLGEGSEEPPPEGSQLKLNMVLRRLPRLRDPSVTPTEAFAGTFHVNESYTQLERAYAEAAVGSIPSVVPCEAYCHSLSDPSILGAELRASGAQTLTVFALHMPTRLFRGDHAAAKRAATEATLTSLNSVLAEPIEDCLLLDSGGQPCLEVHTPVELEAELGMPGGNIFHRDLQWPFAESEAEIGRWGVETAHPHVWLGGAGARRGGGVSGIPGHNVAQAILAARR
jgi:phytoene dehydrogenase-like protein